MFGEYPPAQNQYMQENILGELIFARIHAGPVFALPRIQENIFEEIFPEHSAKFLGEFTRCEYMPRLYSHPREYRKIFQANYLCIGFVPGGMAPRFGAGLPVPAPQMVVTCHEDPRCCGAYDRHPYLTGHQTMEMNGGSSASYLARTFCPLILY